MKTERSHVLFPVPRGPKRKNEDLGADNNRVNIDANFAVNLVVMSTGVLHASVGNRYAGIQRDACKVRLRNRQGSAITVSSMYSDDSL